ncbi:unnamed protein product [Spirodela intermedia]|uniref:Uncharacterized protein n=1 Tax=Spirodela intermedia TaxID=51605 RepID=A0A7I8LFV1_SPIIN|nr:unnamed protein product [Spirodela intermedia]
METEGSRQEEPAKRQLPGRAAVGSSLPRLTEIPDDEEGLKDEVEDDDDDDEDFGMEETRPAGRGRKGAGAGKKPTAQTTKAPTAAATAARRGRPPGGNKLITDVLKPAENAKASPEKKVRKIRPSPFNKKSGSILERTSGTNSASEDSGASPSSSPEEAPPARARPQRANRAPTKKYVVISESESEEDHADDDSDFHENDD